MRVLPVSVWCAHSQDKELTDACDDGRLEDALSAVGKGANANWKDVVSLVTT